MRDLSLHLLDIVQNSISAGADKIDIKICADKANDRICIEINDNGAGMDESFLKEVLSPFSTSRKTRRVGLGIPLLEAACTRADGGLDITSVRFKGTSVKACFKISHIDRAPLGDVAQTMVNLIMGSPDIDYEMELDNIKESFRFSTAQIRQTLGEVPLVQYEVMMWIKEYIDEGIKNIFGGLLDEIIG